MVEFNSEEAGAVLALLERTQVSGKEVETVAYLKNKLKQGLEPQKEEAPKEEKAKK